MTNDFARSLLLALAFITLPALGAAPVVKRNPMCPEAKPGVHCYLVDGKNIVIQADPNETQQQREARAVEAAEQLKDKPR